MKRMMVVGAALGLAGLGAVVQARPQAQAQIQPRQQTPTAIPVAAILPNTQSLLDGYVREGKMPGIVVAIGRGDGPTLFPAAGRGGLEPNAPVAGPDTLWRVYSMTKPITGMAAMMLVEDGRLKLDQPISDFFPGFAKMRVLTSPDTSLETVAAKTPITVRHLLTHTAGLSYSINAKGPILREYERLGIVPAAVNVTVEAKMRATRPKTLYEFATRVATLPLIAEPGTKWSYSIGLDVMAAVVEKASGMPFEQFVSTRLFRPLKMTSSYWQVPASQAGRLATNYSFVGDMMVPLDPAATSVFRQVPSFPYGGAGLVMSARDYDRFLHMLQDGGTLDGARVMKPETVALAMSNLLPAGVRFGGVAGSTGGTNAAVPMGFGAGGSVLLADQPGGAGKGTYGWGGAAGTVAFVDPARRVRGTIMVNYFPSNRYPLREQVLGALAKDAARLGDR